jgi:hypothetical protein
MAEETVWVVMGTTGEYSDRNEWPVRAFFDETAAQEHIEKATKRSAELIALVADCDGGRYSTEAMALERSNEFDPDMQTDYTGTQYFVYVVPVGPISVAPLGALMDSLGAALEGKPE